MRGRGGEGPRGLEAHNPTPPLRKSFGCPKGGHQLRLVGPCPRRASSPSPFVEVASARRGQSPTCRVFLEPLGPASRGLTAPAWTTASAPQPALAASLLGTALAELVFKSWTWVVNYSVGSGLPEEPASLPPVFPPRALHRDFFLLFFWPPRGGIGGGGEGQRRAAARSVGWSVSTLHLQGGGAPRKGAGWPALARLRWGTSTPAHRPAAPAASPQTPVAHPCGASVFRARAAA